MKAPIRIGAAALVCAWLVSGGAQPFARAQEDRVKTIGKRLMCLCNCNQILTECNHVGCSLSTAMLKKLEQQVARNEPEDLTIQSFVQEYGEQVLAEPPAKGFTLWAWIMPFVMVTMGLFTVVMVLRRWRRAPSAGVAVPPSREIPAELLARTRRQAEQETDWDAGPPARDSRTGES